MKPIIFLTAIFIFLASCNTGSVNTNTDITANFTDTVIVPLVEVSRKDIPGQYIFRTQDLVLFDSTIQPNKNQQFDQLQVWSSKATMRNYLNRNFAGILSLKEGDIISVNASFTILKLDSATAVKTMNDPTLGEREQNYSITNRYPPPEEETAALAENTCWGITATCNSPRQNINSGKRVWIIDSGIDTTQEDLNVDKSVSHSWVNGYGYWEVGGRGDEHGTHVAGIIGAKVNGKGCVGIAPNAKLVALKIFRNEKTDYELYLKALDYVLAYAHPGDVLNLSLEGTKGETFEKTAIANIAAKGVFVVIAAGNAAANIDGNSAKLYPSAITGRNIYVVSSYGKQGQSLMFSNFSNYGNSVVCCAPGEEIYSTLPYNRYGTMKGSSMAAPHVAGLLYLYGNLNFPSFVFCPKNNKNYSMAHE